MHGHAPSNPNRVVLFVGGDAVAVPDPHADPRDRVGPGDVVIAADSGLHRALDSGSPVAHVVGDLDSVDPDRLAVARARGATVHRHPADKDATDLELALDLASTLLDPVARRLDGVASIHVVGGGGGRLDHLLGDVLLLTSPRFAAHVVTARFGPARLDVARPGAPCELDGPARTHVSLLPVHGDASGVSTTGLRWPLLDGHLAAGTTRALSNELSGGPATVHLESGVLAVLRPGTSGPPMPKRPGPYDPSPAAPPDRSRTESGRSESGHPSPPAPSTPEPSTPEEPTS